MSKETIQLTINELTFQLAKPIIIRIEKQEDIYIARYKPLNILVYGRSKNEIIEEFNNEFNLLWDCIV